MKILALDTSTSLASIAVTTESSVLSELAFTCQRSLSNRLIQEIDHLLTLAECSISDIDLFGVSLGPGSFTGVRCGVATIQGLGLTTGKPCVGFSSLAMLAMNFSFAQIPVCTLLDARKNEVYAALYDCSENLPKPRIADCVMPIEKFIRQVLETTDTPVIIAGEGGVRYHDTLVSILGTRACFPSLHKNSVKPSAGAFLAHATYLQHGACERHLLVPHYIRPSDAEIARLAKLAGETVNSR